MKLIDKNLNEILVSLEDTQQYFNFAIHENVYCTTHVNYSMEIIIVKKGVLSMIVGGKEYEITEGNAVFVQPYEPHSFISKEDNICAVFVFAPDLVPSFNEFIRFNEKSECLFKPGENLLKLVNDYFPEDCHNADTLKIQAVLFPLCYEIKTKLSFSNRKTAFDDTILKAFNFINKHFSEKITLEAVAKEVGIHPVTLSRKFTEIAKISFVNYLNYQRCTFAASLIEKQDVSFSEIAFSAGFGSIRNFNRIFQSVYGITPTDFKNNPESTIFKYYH